MKHHLLFAGIARVLGTAACKKTDDGKAASAGKAAEVAKPAATPACSEKAYKHTNPDFCLDVPTGFVAKPEEKTGTGTQVKFDAGNDEWFSISWGRWPTAEEAIAAYKSRDEGAVLVVESDLPGGGYFTHYIDPTAEGAPKSHTFAAIAKGTKAYVLCFAGTEQENLVATLVSACKAVRVD